MPLTIIREDASFYQFNCTPNVLISRDARVTEHPVETGANVADNSTPGTLRWSIDAIAASNVDPERTPQDVADLLDDIVTSGERITIDIPRQGRSFGDCVLESYSFPITSRRNFRFTLRVRQILRPTAEFVTIPPRQPVPSAGDLSDSADAGKQGTPNVDEQEDARAKTALLQLAQSLGAFQE